MDVLASVLGLIAQTVEEVGPEGRPRLGDPRRAVLLLHGRDHVADPRRLHDVRGRRCPPQEHHVDGDEEHPHDRRRHAVLLLLRLVHLRLLRARRARRGSCGPGSRVPRLLRGHVALGRPDGAEPHATTSASSSSSPSCSSRGRPASIMSGALIERVRLSAYLLLTVLLGSAVWIMDAAWGWSAGGWLVDEVRLPRLDRVARRARRRGRVRARRPAQPRAADRQVRPSEGGPRAFRPHNTHMTLMGLMLIFTGFYGFYAACLVITVDDLPRLAQHLPLADDARHDRDGDHLRLRRRLHRRLVRQQGRPVLDAVRRPRRRDQRLGGRRRLPPVARLPARDVGRHPGRLRRQLHREEAAGRRRGRRGRGARRSAASTACSSSGSSPAASRPA